MFFCSSLMVLIISNLVIIALVVVIVWIIFLVMFFVLNRLCIGILKEVVRIFVVVVINFIDNWLFLLKFRLLIFCIDYN